MLDKAWIVMNRARGQKVEIQQDIWEATNTGLPSMLHRTLHW